MQSAKFLRQDDIAGPGRSLIIMLKRPTPGAVKTRLAARIGANEAARVYRDIMKATLDAVVADERWCMRLAITPDVSVKDALWPTNGHRVPQGQGNLGNRMERQCRLCGPWPTVIIGSDTPGVTADDVWEAYGRLRDHDVVVGPAVDGGYWLIGFWHPWLCTRAFRDVRWSSVNTLADTLKNIKNCSIAELSVKRDIDTAADLAWWRDTWENEEESTRLTPRRPPARHFRQVPHA